MARTYHPRGELVEGFAPRKHPLYYTWANMLSRCSNPKAPNYADYGGRGIFVCQRWFHFKNFVEDMGIKPSDNHSIDRINNDLGYSPANCKWSTRKEQNSNKRLYRTSETGYAGIRTRDGKYQVRVTIHGKRKSIGNYQTIQEALNARAPYIGKTTI
jgi:hypothetical protein